MMFCDPTTGLCELPQGDGEQAASTKAQATLLFVTDPICSHCWALEPAFRRLLLHYGDRISTRNVYGGLLPGWRGFSDRGAGIGSPADVAPHWKEVADHYGQPIDPSVWLRDPLSSSFPPTMATLAVRLLSPSLEDAYLRRIRQAVFLEARNIARDDVLAACASDVGLDANVFLEKLGSDEVRELFQENLKETRALGARGFPTLIFQGEGDRSRVLVGSQPFERLEAALLEVTGLPRSSRRPNAADLLARYGSGTTREFAEALQVDHEATARALLDVGAERIPVAGDALFRSSWR